MEPRRLARAKQQRVLPVKSQQDVHGGDRGFHRAGGFPLRGGAATGFQEEAEPPRMPDPDAEVIALSPRTLLATNRFVCEICNKGFQRDQNLLLHRRGHNLPWKLKHRNAKDPVRKRVYVCPEPTCVHHNPSRALGDLTGIKKHFCRKHGEKKWKCERCGKKYAVQSDWKAHMKTCGTKEYKCDCGTLFSRDSFITHRAFCDALAEESTRAVATVATWQVVNSNNSHTAGGDNGVMDTGTAAEGDRASAKVVASPPPQPLTPSTSVVSPVLSIQSSDLPENPVELLSSSAPAIAPSVASVTASSTTPAVVLQPPPHLSLTEPASLSLFLSSTATSLFPTITDQQNQQRLFIPAPQPAMSATALLQKVAEMGAAASNTSVLRGLGLAMLSSPSPSSYEDNAKMELPGVKIESVENPQMASGLSLGLMSPHDGSSGFAQAMMAHHGLFVSKPLIVDFLGLGMGHGAAEPGGLSRLLTTLEGGYGQGRSGLYGGDLGSGGGGGRGAWEGGAEWKPNWPTFL